MMHSPSGEKWPQTKSEEARVRAWAQQVANDFVTAHAKGAWGYCRDPRLEARPGGKQWWDNSNTQYAALGLKAARLCGWKPSESVGSSVWRAMLDHFLSVQEGNGPDVQLEVETEKPGHGGVDYSSSGWEKSAGDGYGYRATAQARGWSYRTIVSVTNATTSPSEMSSLNMTIAGLTAVILARTELRSLDKAKEAAANRAVRDGMAWVQRNWPGSGGATGTACTESNGWACWAI